MTAPQKDELHINARKIVVREVDLIERLERLEALERRVAELQGDRQFVIGGDARVAIASLAERISQLELKTAA
jgi:hypothetical protein